MAALRSVLQRGGSHLSLRDLRFALAPAGDPARITLDSFANCMIPLLGSAMLRTAHAFCYLGNSASRIDIGVLREVLDPFMPDATQLDAMLDELDADGDGAHEVVLVMLGQKLGQVHVGLGDRDLRRVRG